MKNLFVTSTLALILGALANHDATAQGNLLEVSTGASSVDNNFITVAVRHQFSEKIRAGLEFHGADYKYRFIGAKLVKGGYAAEYRLPVLWRLYDQGALRADLLLSPGYRYQDEPDEGVKQTSTAVLFDPGLIVTVRAAPRLYLQTGLVFAVSYELEPEALFENQISKVLAGVAYQASDRITVFAKAPFGPAAGGDGDTQKFFWSASAGLRFSLGALKGNSKALVLEP